MNNRTKISHLFQNLFKNNSNNNNTSDVNRIIKVLIKTKNNNSNNNSHSSNSNSNSNSHNDQEEQQSENRGWSSFLKLGSISVRVLYLFMFGKNVKVAYDMSNDTQVLEIMDAKSQFQMIKLRNIQLTQHMSERDYFIFSNMIVYKYPIDVVYIYLLMLATRPESKALLIQSGIYKFCLHVLQSDADIFSGSRALGKQDIDTLKKSMDYLCFKLIEQTKKYYETLNIAPPAEIDIYPPDRSYRPMVHKNQRYSEPAIESITMSAVAGFLYVMVRSHFPGFKGPLLLNAICTAIITPLIVPRLPVRFQSLQCYKDTYRDNFSKIYLYNFLLCLIPMCLISRNYWFPVTYITLLIKPPSYPTSFHTTFDPLFNRKKLVPLTTNDWYYDKNNKK